MAELEPLSSARLPEAFGNYAIVEHLATGGMAEVYIARQTGIAGFERLVVIKRVRGDMIGARELVASLLDEARLVATLQHPNIAQVYEIGCVDGSYFMAMEYIPGADLGRVIDQAVAANDKIAIADAIYIAIQACIALHCAHEKRDSGGAPLGIVHRDVTPSNILLSHDGAVKICDFGIAKATAQPSRTTIGTLKGKYGYMSPEQCRCMPLDRRSDIFSLGILLYELSTLTRAFAAASDFEVLRVIIEGPPPPPSTRVADYPPGLERIVMRALATDPEARYATAQDMQLELEALARDQQLVLSSVNIANLVTRLFGDPMESSVRVRGSAPTRSGGLERGPLVRPRQLGLGSGTALGREPREHQRDHDVSSAAAAARDRPRSAGRPPDIAPRPAAVPRRPSVMWLVGAVLAAAVTIAGSPAGRALDRSDAASSAAVLHADAARIAGMLEMTNRLARGRAMGIATMPILRAAIETDAATMADIAERDAVFAVGADETLEVFQIRGNEVTSLLHLPAGSPRIAPLYQRATRLSATGDTVTLVAGAPIDSATAAPDGATVAGEVALATRVDFAPAISLLAQHAREAWLRGPGIELRLVGSSDTAPDTVHAIPLRTSSELGGLELTLVAVSSTTEHGWLVPMRVAGVIIAGLALACYIWRRWRWQVIPAT